MATPVCSPLTIHRLSTDLRTVWDVLNVASIHNASFPPPSLSSLLPPSTMSRVFTLACQHEYALAYNTSSPVRAIAGATLASQILKALTTTVTAPSHSPRLNIQFGAYASFLSFFGLAQLPSASPDFTGIPDYASTMTFELFTTVPATPFPAEKDIQVRFLFHNGTITADSKPTAFPLFGRKETELPFATFTDEMNKFAVGTQEKWCDQCGNSTGVCAKASTASPSDADGAPKTGSGTGGGHGMGKVVAGVIGAMVTLAVVLGVEALVMLIAELRVVRRRAASRHGSTGSPHAPATKA